MFRKVLMNGLLMVFLLVAGMVYAQDEIPISDEELTNYAVAMDSIDGLKNELKEEYNDLVKSKELMQGGRRFKEILSAGGNETKLAEIEVTEQELQVFDSIQSQYDEWKEEFKEVTNAIIKETVGASAYNRIRKALKEDEALKTKYEALKAALSENAMEDETSTQE